MIMCSRNPGSSISVITKSSPKRTILGQSGRIQSYIKLDVSKDQSGNFPTVHFHTWIPFDRPFLIEKPSTLTHGRPIWLKKPYTIV